MAGKKDGRKKKSKPQSVDEEENVKCGVCEKYLWERDEDVEEDQDQSKNLECEVCLRWFHATCIEDGVATYDIVTKQKAIHWYCQQCDHSASQLHQKLTLLQHENANLRKDLTALTTKVNSNKSAISEIVKTAERNCKSIVENKFETEKAAMKAALKLEIQAEVLGNIEQQIEEAEPDDENNPWSKVVKRNRQIQPEQPQAIPNLRNIISQEISEKKKIELLKYNLIIAGIEEQETEDEETLKQKVTDIIQQQLNISPGIQSAERCGKKREKKEGDPDPKPRPLRIILDNLETRKDILMNATKLRNAEDDHIKTNVFINPDLTKTQQLDAKNLRAVLKETKRQNPNRRYKIKNGQITEVTLN